VERDRGEQGRETTLLSEPRQEVRLIQQGQQSTRQASSQVDAAGRQDPKGEIPGLRRQDGGEQLERRPRERARLRCQAKLLGRSAI
jgi:hypothetical protein